MKSNIIDIDVEVTARTEKAVLVHTGIKEKAVWPPWIHSLRRPIQR